MTNTVDSLPSPVERPGPVVSDPIPQPEFEELPKFAERPGFLSDVNARNDSQTHVPHVNGSSDERSIDLGHFLVVRPPVAAPREYSRTLQKWEGYVTQVGHDTFWARISPIIGEGADQEAEIYLQEVDPEDQSLIEPGAVFYWSIGYLEKPSGRQRVSILRFRRLPSWTNRELNRADAQIARLRDLFSSD